MRSQILWSIFPDNTSIRFTLNYTQSKFSILGDKLLDVNIKIYSEISGKEWKTLLKQEFHSTYQIPARRSSIPTKHFPCIIAKLCT